MVDEIIMKITLTFVGIIITSSVGYLAGKARTYNQKIKDKQDNEQLQNVAIRTILKSQLTKTFFVYDELKEIPDYVYQDFLDMLEVYESFGGNGFIHTLAHKMESWKIIKTGILK